MSKQGAALPPALRFTDDTGAERTLGEAMDGKPAVLVFADYTCGNLCGPILAFAAAGLEKTGLSPGKDFRLIAIGLDPKDSLADAREMKRSRIGDTLAPRRQSCLPGPAVGHRCRDARPRATGSLTIASTTNLGEFGRGLCAHR